MTITLALVTAMRKSELLNLTWGDIDFEDYTVFVSPKQDTDETWEWKIKARYDCIQENLRKTGRWTLCHARTSIVHNFSTQFKNILAKAGVKRGTFHDIRRTAITNWFYQDLSIYDIMKLAGHSIFETTYKFYLQVKDGFLDRARRATTHTVS